MSASLVGSEMCIRDSLCRGGAAGARRTRRMRAKRQAAAASGLYEGFVAVSYTHLTLPTICSV
eukprot:15083623-Alexandrium_andersonii.AAC.1